MSYGLVVKNGKLKELIDGLDLRFKKSIWPLINLSVEVESGRESVVYVRGMVDLSFMIVIDKSISNLRAKFLANLIGLDADPYVIPALQGDSQLSIGNLIVNSREEFLTL